MRAGKGGEDEFTDVGVARVYRQVIAFTDDAHDVVHVAEIKAGVNALRVEVHGHNHDVHIASAFAITKQGAFNAFRPRHYCKFGSCNGAAPVIVSMYAEGDMPAAAEVAAEVFDLVSVAVRSAGFDGIRQVEDNFAPCPRLPDLADGFANGNSKVGFSLRETFRRVFKNPFAIRVTRSSSLQQGRTRNGDSCNVFFAFFIDFFPLYARGGVVQVDDSALGAA